MTSHADWLARYDKALMHTFGSPSRVLVRGQGTRVWDADGRQYLDMLGGLAVNCLGHAHPVVIKAVTEQLSTLGHISNFFASPPQIALAERLDALVTAASPGLPSRVFLTNSGTEANEAAFKITRLTGRSTIIAMEGSFHGRTMGALAITASAKYRDPFAPLPGGVVFVPYGDEQALAAAVNESVAAVVIEPIQGENGVVVAPEGFLRAARELTSAAGALLWIDEVQTGIGRCGDWLASAAEGITADVVTFAKGLGAGFPIGACVATGRAADLMQPGSHGSTFGGNPVAAAVALAVLDEVQRADLLNNATAMGEHLVAAVGALKHPLVASVRGRGLLRGIVLTSDVAADVVKDLMASGFIANAPRPHVIRVAPPLIITQDEIDEFVAGLADALNAVATP